MKKRIFAILTALFCLFTLASCDKDTAYSLYSDAVEKLNSANGYELSITGTTETTVAGEPVSIPVNMTLKANGNNFAMNTTMEYEGESMNLNMVYVDETLYSDMFGIKSKSTLTLEELKNENDSGMITSFDLPGMTEEDLKEIELTKDGDNRSFTVTLTGDAVTKYMEDTMSGLTGLSTTENASVSYGDMTITCTFDKDSNLTNMSLKIVASVADGGETITMSINLNFGFVNIGSAPAISAPADADSYIAAE